MVQNIRLRPVEEADLKLLNELYNTSPETESAFDWFGFADPMERYRRWTQTGLLTAESGTLVVADDAAALGSVTWRRIPFGPLNHGWNIGIGLVAEARGRGIGTHAQKLLARYLFAHTQVNRIDAHTNVRNIAEQRALEKAGFTREGVLREAQFRNGTYHDMVLYSILRNEVVLD